MELKLALSSKWRPRINLTVLERRGGIGLGIEDIKHAIEFADMKDRHDFRPDAAKPQLSLTELDLAIQGEQFAQRGMERNSTPEKSRTRRGLLLFSTTW